MNHKAPDKNKKKPREIFREAWGNMHRIDWLFPSNIHRRKDGSEIEGPRNSEDYLEAFYSQQKLHLNRGPAPYAFSFLETHKDNIVLTGHIVDGPACTPYTILQFFGNVHVICDWMYSWKEERFVFVPTILTVKQLDYGVFLDANLSHEVSLEDEAMGFQKN